MRSSTGLKIAGLALVLLGTSPRTSHREWRVAGGGPESIRYSTLKQINRSNVAKLEIAWTYDTGDAFKGSELQCNPIIVDGVMYAATPKLRIIALDAATGTLLWSFDPFDGKKTTSKVRNRGLVFWEDGSDRRIFFTAYYSLYSLDARTGKPVGSFGDGGRVDLRVAWAHRRSGESRAFRSNSRTADATRDRRLPRPILRLRQSRGK